MLPPHVFLFKKKTNETNMKNKECITFKKNALTLLPPY